VEGLIERKQRLGGTLSYYLRNAVWPKQYLSVRKFNIRALVFKVTQILQPKS
jgi:hypothetical protein